MSEWGAPSKARLCSNVRLGSKADVITGAIWRPAGHHGPLAASTLGLSLLSQFKGVVYLDAKVANSTLQLCVA